MRRRTAFRRRAPATRRVSVARRLAVLLAVCPLACQAAGVAAEARPATRPSLRAPEESEPDSPGPRRWIGTEVRVYPAGVIAAVTSERPVNEHEVVLSTLGGNWTDRRDYGRRDDEEGDGFGGGVGYRHYFGDELDGWFVGGRLELWSLDIDWKDNEGKPNQRKGSSDVLVAQPTADLGYGFRLSERSRLNVFGAFGLEINVATSGKGVGQGPIGLAGVSWVYGF